MTDKAYCVVEMVSGSVNVVNEETLLASATTTDAAHLLRTFAKTAKVGELLWVKGLVVLRMLEADAIYRTDDPNGPNALVSGDGGDHRLRKDTEVFAFDAKRFDEVRVEALGDLLAAVDPHAKGERGLAAFLLLFAAAGILGKARAEQLTQRGSVPVLVDDACRSFSAAIGFWEKTYLELAGKSAS